MDLELIPKQSLAAGLERDIEVKFFLSCLLVFVGAASQAKSEAEAGEYKEGGKGAASSFTFEMPFSGYGTKQFIDPIRQACTRLNDSFFKKNPAGEMRSCKLVKYTAMPKTMEERPDGDRFTHVYTAPSLGKENLRFVMLFGQQTVNVNCVLHAKP